jgi:hypothetical protein
VLIGLRQVASTAPVVTGAISRETYLTGWFRSYGAIEYLNNLPRGTRVVFYGEPLGYYCNQPYMWGEQGHSTLIPYDTLTSPEAIREYMLDHNVHYVLWNIAGFQPSSSTGWDANVVRMLHGSNVHPVYLNSRDTVGVFRL